MSAYAGGCYTTNPADWRGRTTEQWVQDGWIVQQRGDYMTREPVMRKVTTEWIPTPCGRLDQIGHVDINCRGCAHDAR